MATKNVQLNFFTYETCLLKFQAETKYLSFIWSKTLWSFRHWKFSPNLFKVLQTGDHFCWQDFVTVAGTTCSSWWWPTWCRWWWWPSRTRGWASNCGAVRASASAPSVRLRTSAPSAGWVKCSPIWCLKSDVHLGYARTDQSSRRFSTRPSTSTWRWMNWQNTLFLVGGKSHTTSRW